MKLKKILIIIDESNFYHPDFFYSLCQKLKLKKFEIVVGLVTEVEEKNSIEKYLKKNLRKLYIKEILFLSLKKLFFKLFKNIFCKFNIFFSVKSAVSKLNLDFFEIKNDINKKIYINQINKIKPDLIISSCSLIFNKEILEIPIFGCINRHTSLLPSFGGVYPVFHSIAEGNKFSGVTVHTMTSRIDDGLILAQDKILNTNNNLSKIYKEGFKKSIKLVLLAIDNLLEKRFLEVKYKKSYYSFPNEDDWIRFRKNKGKFI
mgnify:CR=1 FL=1|tara:strand:- start:8273 stop:9052 length:780 start_codon:yes stop_codon:yes gene_type:complete